jgi:hypothetical protein
MDGEHGEGEQAMSEGSRLPELGAVGFEEPHEFAADATGPAGGQWCACGQHEDDEVHG